MKTLAEIKATLSAIPVGRIVNVDGFDVKHHKGGMFSNGFGKKRIPLTLDACAETIDRVGVWARKIIPYVK